MAAGLVSSHTGLTGLALPTLVVRPAGVFGLTVLAAALFGAYRFVPQRAFGNGASNLSAVRRQLQTRFAGRGSSTQLLRQLRSFARSSHLRLSLLLHRLRHTLADAVASFQVVLPAGSVGVYSGRNLYVLAEVDAGCAGQMDAFGLAILALDLAEVRPVVAAQRTRNVSEVLALDPVDAFAGMPSLCPLPECAVDCRVWSSPEFVEVELSCSL